MTDLEIKKNVSKKAVDYGIPNNYSFLYDDLSYDFKKEFESQINRTEFGIDNIVFGKYSGIKLKVNFEKLPDYEIINGFLNTENWKIES